jgi:NADPH-ferrihemoprotein reductase
MEASTCMDLSLTPYLLTRIATSVRPTSTSDAVSLILAVAIGAAYVLRGVVWDKPDPFRYIYFERPQRIDGGAGQQRGTRNIAQKLEGSKADCVVFWGSQSGTAEGFANRLAKEIRARFSLFTLSADLSDYDPETIALIPESKLVIFILSTYGEGDPSDNTAGFWAWINQAQGVSLNHIRYAAFGLGNSNYKHYNQVIAVVTEKLNTLGATQVLPTARADDALQSTEEDFVTWRTDLFSMFKERLQLEEKEAEYQPTFEVIEDHSLEPIDLYLDEPLHPRTNPRAAASSSPIRSLLIKETRELHTSGDRNCVHMELDISEHPELVYKTGDHLAVWPTNADSEVDILLDALNLQARRDTPVLMRQLDTSSRLKVPSPTTITALFRTYLEIGAPVSRDTTLALAQFAPSTESKAFLVKLGSDRSHFTHYASQNYLTLGRLLTLAAPNNVSAWSTLPLSFIVESLPSMQPRYYSISSSSVLSPQRISITALVSVDELLPSSSTQHAQIHGLTTSYLLAHSRALSTQHTCSRSLAPPTYFIPAPRIHAHIRKSKFKLPISPSTPVIMVAAGTGLAPFRAFITERAKLYATRGRDSVGEMALFFGCRNQREDRIYHDEIDRCRERMEGKFRLSIAFSRPHIQTIWEDEATREANGEYVQNLLSQEAHGSEVLRLLDNGASFYICGRTQMAREVTKAVMALLRSKRGQSEEDAWEEVEGMKRRGKWREDVWG